MRGRVAQRFHPSNKSVICEMERRFQFLIYFIFLLYLRFLSIFKGFKSIFQKYKKISKVIILKFAKNQIYVFLGLRGLIVIVNKAHEIALNVCEWPDTKFWSTIPEKYGPMLCSLLFTHPREYITVNINQCLCLYNRRDKILAVE